MDFRGTHSALVLAMGIGNQEGHPWIQERQVQQPGEQQVPSMGLSYETQVDLPTGSYTATRIINSNYESTLHEQTYAGILLSICGTLTIPIELLDENSALPNVGLDTVVFLGPHLTCSQRFLNSRGELVMRAINFLTSIRSLKRITLSLDLLPITGILAALGGIHNLEEIALTPSTARALTIREVFDTQQALTHGLGQGRIKRLTFPMEFITPFLLSHLTKLPYLECLTAKYCPPRRQRVSPAWSSYKPPKERPAYIFLQLLKFDPRRYFQQLRVLDVGASSSDGAYSALKKLFPKTHVC